MKALSQFFDKYKNIAPPDVVIRDSVVLLFDEYFSFPITREQVKVRSGVVYIDCPSLVKSEVFLNKKKILDELLRRVSPHRVRDIR